MFNFLKSKKGFTLVELMIVVVIMAILVAVAVPIYSAVTKNARKKTCLANQREIQSQLNNAQMAGTISIAAGDTYTLTTNGTSDGGTWAVTTTATATNKISDTSIAALFQKAPYCPVASNTITVTVAASGIGGEEDGFKELAKYDDNKDKAINKVIDEIFSAKIVLFSSSFGTFESISKYSSSINNSEGFAICSINVLLIKLKSSSKIKRGKL